MSNRLTFSLASLILIFVAGFVLLTPSTADAVPPSWDGNATSDQSWNVGDVINLQLRTATDNDNDTITYSLSPALPEGLSFNAVARTIVGMATKGAKTKEYTYTATAAGDSITDKFNIGVSSSPKFDPATKLVRYLKVGANRVIQFPTAIDEDEDPVTHTIDNMGSIPAGMTYVSSFKQLVGEPTTAAAEVVLTWKATDSSNNATNLMVGVTVEADKTPVIGGALSDISGVVGTAIGNAQLPTATAASMNHLLKTDDDGNEYEAITYSLDPSLPAGLKLDEIVSGVWIISGTPTAAKAETEYTWTATDPDGDKGTKKFKITVNATSTTPPPTGAPAKPTAVPTVPAAPTGLAIALSWTAHTDTTVTGYEVKVYKGDTAAAATASTTAIATESVTGATTTTYTYTATEADRGKYFAFTVAGVNAQGTGAHSDKGTPVMVPMPSTGVPAVMDAPTATSDDRKITVSWTAHTDATVTGYQLERYKGDTAAAATASTTPMPFIVGPAGANVVWKASVTSWTITVPEADRGKYFAFTIRARNDTGFGPFSDKSTPVLANNAPAFDEGAAIADIDIWKGQDYESAALPIASDNVGDTVTHTFDPALPTGFAPVQQGNTSKIKVTGTVTAPASVAALKDKAFKYVATDSAGATAELSFKITLKAPIAPTASPSDDADTFMVSEKGLADWQSNWVDGRVLRNGVWVNGKVPVRRAVNTNEVELDWEAPTEDARDAYGSEITKYTVYWERMSPKASGTWDVLPAKAGDAPPTEFTTPKLDNGTYHFDVTASNDVGESQIKEPSHNTVTICSAPGVPSDLRAAVDQNADAVTLVWKAPSSTGGCPITGYVVHQTDENNNNVLYFHQNTTTNFRTPSLSTGQYVFRVATVNKDDKSIESDGTQFKTIVSVDQPPEFEVTNIDDITIMGGDMLSPIITLPKAKDPEGENVSYSVSPSLPSGLIFNATASVRSISGTAMNVAADVTTHHTYTATDGTQSATLTFSVTVTRLKPATIEIPTATSSSAPISLGTATVPAYGFYVLVRDVDGSGTYTPLANTWQRSGDTSLPDLAWFFGTQPDARGGKTNGGTIALNGPGEKKDLVISEVMWGTDSSLAVPARSQWIEFYNATGAPISLAGYAITFHRSQVHPSAWANARDIVSNVSGHSIYFAPSELPGQSGRSNVLDSQGRYEQQRDLVSMYRQIDHVGVKHYHTGNRGERDKRITGWAASVYPTANIQPVHIATPGAEQISHVTIAKTTFSQSVIINEIGNSANDDYDWIELHNTTNAAIKLRKWDFTMIVKEGNVGKEKRIFQFPDDDTVWVPANGFLVIARTHPRNDGNDLAAGIDVTKAAIDQLKRGLGEKDLANHPTAYYYVNSGLVLPNDTTSRLFVLRNANDKHGQPSHVVDTVGTLSIEVRGDLPNGFTGYAVQARQLWNTATWPFQGAGGKHGNVIDGGDEDFRAGKVYQRNGKNSGIGEKHLAVRGYTGVGYDRHAAVNGENGGTPGYHKDVVKGDKSNWANQVTFSEVMLVTEEGEGAGRVPRATRLPQWVEIYNASLTEAVSINNWYLEVQNDDTPDFFTNLHGTLRLPNVIIQPNQTVLIVSNSGLNSGNFPEQRTINVFTNGTYRQILGLTRRGEPMLNPKGFYIELRDHKGNSVDEIGNLGVSRRTGTNRRDNFGEQWEMPSLHSQEGHRTSLIRIYDNGVPRSGLNGVGGPKDASTSWTLASSTNFQHVPSLSYYGNHRDFGTPGYRGGGPLPVSLSKFRPERLDSGEVVIRWVTESELNNAGFNILRSDTRGGEFTKVNTQLIKGQGTTSERTAYEWKDTTAKPNVAYYYQIQDVSLDGQITTLRVNRLKGNVTAAGKATTTWGKLKALQ